MEKTKVKMAGTGLKTNSSCMPGIRELETFVQKKSLQSLKTRTAKRTRLLNESNLWKQQSATKTRGRDPNLPRRGRDPNLSRRGRNPKMLMKWPASQPLED